MMVEMVSLTAPRPPTAAADDVCGYCDIRASAGDTSAAMPPLPSLVPAPLGMGDRVDGWREPAPPIGDATMVAIWSCQLRPVGSQPADQP